MFEVDPSVLAEPPTLNKYIEPAMRKMVQQKESIVQRAVVEVIGRAWTASDIKNRCRFERILGETWETLVIDGEPVLMLFDMEVSPAELRGDSYISNVSQRYRYIGRAAHLNGGVG
jgi:hypothetical protein